MIATIKDKVFKGLNHTFKSYQKFLDGGEIENGYKPDFVLKKNNEYIILESENSSSRKLFIGGLIKASHFLTGKKSGILLFVMVPKKNTTAISIAKQIKVYFSWIKDKTNLKEVWIIECNKYYDGIKCIPLDSRKFNEVAIKIN